jgi:hypothetical protein
MITKNTPTLEGQYPLPEGVKLRKRKFGTSPVSPLVQVQRAAVSAPTDFEIGWKDSEHGLTLVIREQRENGRLVANVFCSDSGHLNKLAVSVGLVGMGEERMIRKTIPLVVAEKNGCSGSADFGPLAEAVEELGDRLGVVVFMLV